jgi:sodium/potassium/calcium exchanger 5
MKGTVYSLVLASWLGTVYGATNASTTPVVEPVGTAILDASLSIMGLLYLFLGLAIVCDDYLVPAIEILCETLQIPEEAAGASFLAFGSAAPEILLNAVATAEGQLDSMESSLSAIQGSAIIAFGLIPGLCALVAPGGSLTISWGPMLRDSLVYIISLVLLVCIIHDSYVTSWESAGLCAIYFLYLLLIFIPIWLHSCRWTSDKAADAAFVMPTGDDAHMVDHALTPHKPLLPGGPMHHHQSYGTTDTGDDEKAPKEDDANDNDDAMFATSDSICLEYVRQALDVLSRPFRLLFAYTLPECTDDAPTRVYYPVTLVLSIAYVGLLSFGALYFTRRLSDAMHLSTTLAGATLLALGAQIPDTIASVALARAGHADAAVCNAIGSQVINVTLGTGFPWVIYTLLHGMVRHDISFIHLRTRRTFQ